jgi:hypothetical protein
MQLRRNRLYKQLLDCEIVLRFFTLRTPENLATSMRKSLDDTMEEYSKLSREHLDPLRQDFRDCLEISHALYGASTFRLEDHRVRAQRRPPLSRALYDAVMLGVYALLRNKEKSERAEVSKRLRGRKSWISAETQKTLQADASYELLVGRLNTKQSILDRITLMENVFTQALV